MLVLTRTHDEKIIIKLNEKENIEIMPMKEGRPHRITFNLPKRIQVKRMKI